MDLRVWDEHGRCARVHEQGALLVPQGVPAVNTCAITVQDCQLVSSNATDCHQQCCSPFVPCSWRQVKQTIQLLLQGRHAGRTVRRLPVGCGECTQAVHTYADNTNSSSGTNTQKTTYQECQNTPARPTSFFLDPACGKL